MPENKNPEINWKEVNWKSFFYPSFDNLVNTYGVIKRRLCKRGEYIFIASLPKTGSTFLGTIMSELTGFKYLSLSFRFHQNEPDLYLPTLIYSWSFGTVSSLHTRATEANLVLFNAFSIKPVILVRNIFDIVISLADHIQRESKSWHMFHINDDYLKLDDEKKTDFIIEMGLPWLFNFYTSWYNACNSGCIEAKWLTYETFLEDKIGTVRSLADFYGITKSDKEIEMAIERADRSIKKTPRYNKGIMGRGERLTDIQREKITGMAKYYPNVDFSLIGIG